jgi:hypothetical protein
LLFDGASKVSQNAADDRPHPAAPTGPGAGADETDDLLLDDALLTLLDDDVLLDDELLSEEAETLLDTELDRLLVALLVLDIEEVDETLAALLLLEVLILLELVDDTLDDTDEAIEELLTLPLPAALDELFATVPPLQAAISTAITASEKCLPVKECGDGTLTVVPP